MIALIQRVSEAAVHVEGQAVASIGPGLVALIAVQPADDQATATRLCKRLLNYRVFADADGRMNLNLQQVGGALLLVPQFTLAADTRAGNRPSFTSAASPALGRKLFDALVADAAERHSNVAAGSFGANMSVSLVNEGPATFWLEVS